MDRFFTQKYCDRCGGSLKDGRILSMLNTQVLCMSCKEKETKEDDYDEAVKAEFDEVKKGNYNYKGLKG